MAFREYLKNNQIKLEQLTSICTHSCHGGFEVLVTGSEVRHGDTFSAFGKGVEVSVALLLKFISDGAHVLDGATLGSGVLAKLAHEIGELSGNEEAVAIGVGGLPCCDKFGLDLFRLSILDFHVIL